MGEFSSAKERQELKEQHRGENQRRYADRIKGLLLWDSGWTLEHITEKPVGFAVSLWRRVFVVPPGDANGQ